MKRLADVLFRDLVTKELNELLDSWALLFAIIPFGGLIFYGMYVGQFVLNSTSLGVVLMFAFPLAGFTLLACVRAIVGQRRAVLEETVPALAGAPAEPDAEMVVVRCSGPAERGGGQLYTLRRKSALENSYVQKGSAASVSELYAQFGELYPNTDWTHIVAEPPRKYGAPIPGGDARSG